MDSFDARLVGRTNEKYERCVFNNCKQGAVEFVEDCIAALRTLSKICKCVTACSMVPCKGTASCLVLLTMQQGLQSGCSTVGNTSLVYQDAETPCGSSSSTTSEHRSPHTSRHRGTTPSSEETASDCTPPVRQVRQTHGLPEDSANTVMAAWTNGTKRCCITDLKRRFSC